MTPEELEGRIAKLRAERKQMSIQDFILDVESRHFRTNSDTGANSNALFIWNMVREWAGMERLTKNDLRQRQVDTSDVESIEDLKKYEEWYREYRAFTDYAIHKRNFEQIVAKGGLDYLFPKQEDDK